MQKRSEHTRYEVPKQEGKNHAEYDKLERIVAHLTSQHQEEQQEHGKAEVSK